MLDLEYPNIEAFTRGCRAAHKVECPDEPYHASDFDADLILLAGDYVVQPDGRVVSTES